ncbi:MAG TPA: gamma-glutamyltransferase [Bacteroidetes bacterium]|nr:gamma-glutamyltransferase [Bacteroidota bacterium]
MRKTRGLIAAGHIATAEAAAMILREGGNAFDAAVAALLATFTAEPCMSSAGGGAFMTAFRSDGTALVYDFFVQTPKVKKRAEEIEYFPIELDFGTAKEVFYVGMGSVGVPGTIGGAFEIAKHLGSLPMDVLAAPAIQMAREGVDMDDFQFHDFNLLEKILKLSHPSPVFWKGDRLLKVGEKVTNPDWANCLDFLVRDGIEEFYQGDVAKLILKLNDAKGGHLSAKDLASYRTLEHAPLVFPYRDRTVITNPGPSLGGNIVAIALAMLEKKGVAKYARESVAHVENIMDVFSRVDEIPRTPAALAQALAHWYPGRSAQAPAHNSRKIGGTSHFSILDEHGNAVSISTSNGEGCGHFVPETGIQLNNMLGEMALLPHGVHSWTPNVRLGSMMAPTVVLDAAHKAEIVLGSGGAGRIPFMLTQVLHNMIDLGMNLKDAVDAPRQHWHAGIANLEPGLPSEVQMPASLKSLVSWEQKSLFFGGVHAVCQVKNGMEAEGDQRRGGVMLNVE